jgi:hypothetical protein
MLFFCFYSIAGPNTSTDWAIEGRRLIPLMPRLVPQTAFTALANNVANIAAAENAKLPPPANIIKKNCKFNCTSYLNLIMSLFRDHIFACYLYVFLHYACIACLQKLKNARKVSNKIWVIWKNKLICME